MFDDLTRQQAITYSVVGGVVTLISLAVWWHLSWRMKTQQRVLDLKPRWLVSWGLLDVIGAVLLSFFCAPAAVAILEATTDFDRQAKIGELSVSSLTGFFFAMSIGSAVAIILSLIVIRIRVGAKAGDFGIGWKWEDIRKDLVVGVLGFFALVVPVLAIQVGATQLLGQETQHPIIKALKSNTDGEWLWMATICSAVLVAPIVEELLVRVILQGWFENIASGKMNEIEVLSGLHSRFRTEPVPAMPGIEQELKDLSNEKAKPATHHWYEPTAAKAWPIVLSAALFSLMHVGNGPDPIPLFVLALGLGYVYHCTHRVLPCIIIHFLMNLLSLFWLWVALRP